MLCLHLSPALISNTFPLYHKIKALQRSYMIKLACNSTLTSFADKPISYCQVSRNINESRLINHKFWIESMFLVIKYMRMHVCVISFSHNNIPPIGKKLKRQKWKRKSVLPCPFPPIKCLSKRIKKKNP